MLAVVALVLFIIGAILSWVDKTISVDHLLFVGFAGWAFLAGHLIWGWWGTTHGRSV
jgi:hypothetical protein